LAANSAIRSPWSLAAATGSGSDNPPIAEPLASARREADACRSDAVEVAALILVSGAEAKRDASLSEFVREIVTPTSGRVAKVDLGDDIGEAVNRFLATWD
jgi:hypothetical protein